MKEMAFPYGSFSSPFEHGYIYVHPEMAPAAKGISPTGRYFVYCLHNTYGTCHFILKQNENCEWMAEVYPPFIGLVKKAF